MHPLLEIPQQVFLPNRKIIDSAAILNGFFELIKPAGFLQRFENVVNVPDNQIGRARLHFFKEFRAF